MPKTVHQLDVPLHSAAFLGISCAEPILRFSWLLNRQLGVDFVFSEQSHELIAPFATFQFFDEELSLQFLLIANKAEEKRLSTALKNLDYILICIGPEAERPLPQWSMRIKKIEGVVGCYPLPTDKGVLKKLAAILVK